MTAVGNGDGAGKAALALRGVETTARRALPIGECLHPGFLLALILLAVNDWVLKPSAAARWGHGALTGKLSDVAGLVIAPLLVTGAIGLVLELVVVCGARLDPSLRLRRATIACALIALGFAAVKLSPWCAHEVASLLSHLGRHAAIVPDPTDLVALPAVGLAWWIARREVSRVPLGRVHGIACTAGPAAAQLADVVRAGGEPAAVAALAAAIERWRAAPADPVIAAEVDAATRRCAQTNA